MMTTADRLLSSSWDSLSTNDRRVLFLILQGRLCEFASSRGLRFIYFTFHRSLADQAAQVAKGTSSTLRSLHRKWRAVDLVLLGFDGRPVWTCPRPPARSDYLDLGEWWESQHVQSIWGGRWTKPFDPYHFQLGEWSR